MPSSVRARGAAGNSSGSGGRTSLPVTPMSERQQMALLMQMTSTAGTSRNTSTHRNQHQPLHNQQHQPANHSRSRERNERGETPLHLAAIRGDVEQVGRLLSQRATDPNAVDFAGWTPLHEACNHGWRDVADQLLQAGAVVNARGLDDDTPLHDAASNGHLPVVCLLLEQGADVHAKNRKGRTPYDVATVDVAAYIREHTSAPSTSQQTESNAGQRVQPRPRDDKKLSVDSGGGGNKKNDTAEQQQQSGQSVKSTSSEDVYEFKSVKDINNSNSGNAPGDSKSSMSAGAGGAGTDPLDICDNIDPLASAGTGAAMVITSGSGNANTSSTASVGGSNSGGSSDDMTGVSATVPGNKRTYGEVSGGTADMADDTVNNKPGVDEETRRKKRKDSDSVKDGKSGNGNSQGAGGNAGVGGGGGGRGAVLTGKSGTNKPGPATSKNNCGSANSTVKGGGGNGSVNSGGGSMERKTSPCSSPKPTNTSVVAATGTIASVGPGTASSTGPGTAGGGTSAVGMDGVMDQDDSRADLKVPPLKIVIPQGSSAGTEPESGGARTGKSSSQRIHHHQALPYVVTSATNSTGSNEPNTTSTTQQLTTTITGNITTGNTSNNNSANNTTSNNNGSVIDKDNTSTSGNNVGTESTGAPGQCTSTQAAVNTGTKTNNNNNSNEDNNKPNTNSNSTGQHEDQKSTSGGHHQRVLRSSHRSSGGGSASNTGGTNTTTTTTDRHSNNSSPLLHQQQQQQQRSHSPSPNNSPAGTTADNNTTNNTTNSNNNGSTSTGTTGSAHNTGTTATDTDKSATAASGSVPDAESAGGGTGNVTTAQQQQQQQSGTTTGSGNAGSTTGNGNNNNSGSSSSSTSASSSTNVELHPRKRKMRPNKETPSNNSQTSTSASTAGSGGNGSQQQQQQHGADTSGGTVGNGDGSGGTTTGSAGGAGPAGTGAGVANTTTTATGTTTTTSAAAATSSTTGGVLTGEVHPHEQPITNCYQLYLNIRRQIERRRKSLFPVQPKPPQGFKDYLMNRCTYVLAGTAPTVPTVTAPATVPAPMRDLYGEQERDRYRLRMQHVIEKEKLVLSVEQEILRVHGRAARALANQSLPFSVCTVLRDEEVYNVITPEQEEKDRNARSRYNGRLFLSWLQDVDDKWEKIKEHMLLRHHNEAESLHAVQRMAWEWTLKEQLLCEYKARPHIDDMHVPQAGHGQYRLILATNRDEYYARPAEPAHVWPGAEHIIAGTDLETGREGGTWFGVSVREQQLRAGALLNVTGEPRVPGAPGRGCIVTDYLRGSNSTSDYVTGLRADPGRNFNAFTFVSVELGLTSGNVYCYNNVTDELIRSHGGSNGDVWYACGNSLQHEPLAKVSAGALRFRNTVEQLQAAVSERETLIGELTALLKWTVPHVPDPVLERRVPSAEVRHSLSSVYVSIPDTGYGTRTHTILLVDHTGRVEFLEDTAIHSSTVPTGWHHTEHLAQL